MMTRASKIVGRVALLMQPRECIVMREHKGHLCPLPVFIIRRGEPVSQACAMREPFPGA